MSAELCFLLGCALWLMAPHLPPHWWYISPSKRRAMRIARQTAMDLHQVQVDGTGCWTKRKDREKCFVFLQHKGIARPPSYSVFVVWKATDQVDNLGIWQFHWGLFWSAQPIEAYEQCRAAGVPWPVGLLEWMEWAKRSGFDDPVIADPST